MKLKSAFTYNSLVIVFFLGLAFLTGVSMFTVPAFIFLMILPACSTVD